MQMSSDAYMFILDLTSDTLRLSEKATKRFPFRSVMIENCMEIMKGVVHPSDYEALVADLEECRSGERESHVMEYRWLDRMNRVVWISCRGTAVQGAEGHRLLIGAVSELGKKAKADNITGLRREVRFRLNMEETLRDHPETVRFLMRIGIDNFKEINEKEGAKGGDEVLRELANCIIKNVDESVDIYRLVADEFMVVDTGKGKTVEPGHLYRQIQKTIAATARNKEYSRFYTVSAGVLQGYYFGEPAPTEQFESRFIQTADSL